MFSLVIVFEPVQKNGVEGEGVLDGVSLQP